MQEIKLNKNNKIEVIRRALEVLNSGGVIVYPTETSYGLGANFFDPRAVRKIYQIKKRNKSNFLPVIVPDYNYAVTMVNFPFLASNLAQNHWAGPLTLVLPFRHKDWQKHFPDHLALRVSSQPFVQDLSMQFGLPLVATSANISDRPDSYTPQKVRKDFSDQLIKPDLFINAGVLQKNSPSTIVSFVDEQPKILRQGNLKINL